MLSRLRETPLGAPPTSCVRRWDGYATLGPVDHSRCADSGFYNHAIRETNVRQHQTLHTQIEAIPEGDWTPIPYWMDGAADVAETT